MYDKQEGDERNPCNGNGRTEPDVRTDARVFAVGEVHSLFALFGKIHRAVARPGTHFLPEYLCTNPLHEFIAAVCALFLARYVDEQVDDDSEHEQHHADAEERRPCRKVGTCKGGEDECRHRVEGGEQPVRQHVGVAADHGEGDAFAERNAWAMKVDYQRMPPFFEVSPGHKAATWLLHPQAPKVEPPLHITPGQGSASLCWTDSAHALEMSDNRYAFGEGHQRLHDRLAAQQGTAAATGGHTHGHPHDDDDRPLLELQDLRLHFRPGRGLTVRAVDGLDLAVRRGEMFGLVGESGCGKSTLARAVMGLYPPTTGRILFDGHDIHDPAPHLRQERQRQMQIIFVTGYMEYIQEGYDVGALHYLLKPVSQEKIDSVLDRAVERLKTADAVLLVESGGEALRLPLKEIRFIESNRNYNIIHADNDYEMRGTLSELEEKLDEAFVRVGRSYLVNLHYVRRIGKTELILNTGEKLLVPRGSYKKLNEAFIKYF